MKLWVAENVLNDYTSGIAIIYAESEKKAIDILYRDSPLHCWVLYNYPECNHPGHNTGKTRSEDWWKHHKPDKLPPEFKLIKDASAFTLSGGG